ncbi:MAG: guanitoxin biosynthesis heme-dependent pre-guanitoxin N-hydroxylase GntA [Brevundimonas sp.]
MLPVVNSSHPLAERFQAFVGARDFPCVGSKSALFRKRMSIIVAGNFECPADDARIHRALVDFAAILGRHGAQFQSFVVVFEGPTGRSEIEFEAALWRRLQALSDLDAADHLPYDPTVSSSPEDADFSLSFGGEAYFIVGLHPGASRPARRFGTPAIAFNPHHQFRTLREAGRYEGLRESVIARDLALCGSINPMLSRHGERSEARQYSGRAVDGAWTCPLQARDEKKGDA